MALCLLAHDWAASRGGRITALIVDHGLRPDAAAEARQVRDWLKAADIRSHILRWRQPDDAGAPASNIQAQARAARYRLLTDWCREKGVLHLFTGHHRDDQAETLMLRLARGSGVDGLAAMPARRETADICLLRPFLSLPRERLAATLRRRKQGWIEDPSNQEDRFARVRVRTALAALGGAQGIARRLGETATRLGDVRAALEEATARLLVRAVTIAPMGFATIDRGALAAAPREIGLRALARVLPTIAGADYPPRFERLERLYNAVTADAPFRGRTLGGCRIFSAPDRMGDGRLVVSREAAAVEGPVPLVPGTTLDWDGRFRVVCPKGRSGLTIGALGSARPTDLDARAARRLAALPAAIRGSMPAFRDRAGVFAIPHLGYLRPRSRRTGLPEVRFAPCRPLATAHFS